MKRSYFGVISLCAILFMDIVFMQLLVHQYFHQNYKIVLLFMFCNIILFPIALYIYKQEINKGGQSHEKK
ncbi:hypothetical protein [Aquibacillus rhizosphaerae]|uniref:Uncharacterized protein n=1 Tax=Aquibacillus rhizosphaerae TaxID=3051431 RepID=A0ABT7LBI2_9BACI|nr:hypothetical protein [Aquibacillus sp. LR5S19]MDL4841915.1 hypothetical protein [Aquibacillus sp. LR5S19]